ncbi:hypothetical protein [Algibacter sp. L3A6]|uniref:hypothetical protein n=1 Tax=Algibacter sp. L3A6 TaxID=2686366 RepID=UPI00131E3FC8|nr:hypothetical protein [Algibacter sp. L3A6]
MKSNNLVIYCITKALLYAFLVLITTICYSQKEAAFWYFANHAGLGFNSGSAKAVFGGQLKTNEV